MQFRSVLLPTLLLLLSAMPTKLAAGGLTIEEARVIVTGHDVNRPDPFPGRGKFGWPGNIARLSNNELILVHTAGYYHVSFAEPRNLEPTLRKNWLAEGWPVDYPAPTGGRSMRTLSRDGGRTWGKPETLIDLRLDDGAYGILRCRDGTLLAFINVQASWYGYRSAPPEFENDIDGLNTQQCVVRSTDDGQTWSKPIWLKSPATYYERSHAQPVELPDGGILWPCYGVAKEKRGEFAVIHRSDDSGKSWRVVSTRRRDAPGKILDEPAITTLNDGRLLMVCRPDGGLFYSNDDAVTWTESGSIVRKGRFKAPRLFVLEDNTVVCVATYRRLNVFLGRDGGTSWTRPLPLDPTSYGYPGGLRLEDGSFLISYCSSGRAPNRIYVVRFRVNSERDGIELLRIDGASE